MELALQHLFLNFLKLLHQLLKLLLMFLIFSLPLLRQEYPCLYEDNINRYINIWKFPYYAVMDNLLQLGFF